MKKNKLTFLIAASFLALGALVGCNADEPSEESKNGVESDITTSQLINPSSDIGNSQSSQGGGGNTSQGGGNTSQGGGGNTSQGGGNTSQGGGGTDVKTDWTDAEKATMRNALHGLVLPFVDMETTVRTNNDGSSVKIESQQNMSGNFLASYAEKFTYEDGWTGGDISYEFEVSYGNAFAYQKAITENGKKYYVSVMFMGVEQNAGSEQVNISKTGRFYLEASDPYEYTYPAAFIGQWLGQQFGTTIVPPAFEAEYYNLDSEGVLIGYSERNIEDSYKTSLLSSGNFTIDSARNDDGYLIARPVDGSYILLFKYDSTNKIMILQVMENTGWNTPQINAFFIKYNKRPFDIPAFSDDNVTFKFEEVAGQPAGYEMGKITIGRVTTQKVQAYINSLKAAGYILIDDAVTDVYQWGTTAQILTDEGIYALDITYYPNASPKKLEIYISLFVDTSRVKAWPAAQMAAIAQASQDIVPEYTGNHIGFHAASQGVTIYVEDGQEEGARDAYIRNLLAAKYTLVDGHYISEHSEIDVEVICNANKWPGQINIAVKPYVAPAVTQWPASDIAQAMASNLPSATDTIPEIDVSSANECTVNDNLIGEFTISISGGSVTADTIKTAFKNAGWLEDIYYDYDFNMKGGLVSPSRQLVAHVQTLTEEIVINIKLYFAQSYTVVGVGGVWDYNYSEIAFVDATIQSEVNDGMYAIQSKATFNVVSGDKFKVTNGIEWYGIEAVEDGVSTVDFAKDGDDNIVANKAGEVNLYFKTMADGSKKIYLAYTAAVPQTVNPVEAIEEYFGDDTFNSIPWFAMEGATYQVTNYGEGGGIKFMDLTVSVDDAGEAFVGFFSYLSSDNDFVEHPDYPGFYVKKDCPAYSFGYDPADNNSFIVTVAVLEEKVYTVLGLDGNWDIEAGEELKPVENPASGYFAQYVATFEVEADEEFKVTDGAIWYGFTELVTNEYFKVGASDDNIAAKQNGSVAMTFGVLLDGTRVIVIEFTPEGGVTPSVYPSEQIANYLNGITVSDYLLNPIIADAEYEITEPTVDDPYLIISITKDGYDIDDYSEADSDLTNGLFGEGFIAKEGTDKIGPALVSPNGDYCVNVSYSDYSLEIHICNFDEYYEPMKTTYFLEVDNDWDVSAGDAVFYAWVWGGEYGEGEWIELTYNDQTHSFALYDILDGATGFKVVRFNPDAEGIPYFPGEGVEGVIWNDTIDYSFAGQSNDITISFRG